MIGRNMQQFIFFTEILPVGVALIHADGRTDMGALHDYSNALEKYHVGTLAAC